MNFLRNLSKLWQPKPHCCLYENEKATQLSSIWNFLFSAPEKMSKSLYSGYSQKGQNNSQSVLSTNLLRYTNPSSSASSVISNILPIETQLGTFMKNKYADRSRNSLTNFTRRATVFLGDSLEHMGRNPLNPCVDYNIPMQRRLSYNQNLARISYFSKLYAPKSNNGSHTILSNARRCFGTSASEGPDKWDKMKVPKLILIRNPLTWLSTKFNFRILKSLWDPQFVEEEFKEGTVKAISTVTQILSDGKFEDLVGLLTKPARTCLLKEVTRSWPGRKLKLIGLSPGDIQISVPRKVYFLRIADKKFCDIDMAFMALKWISTNRKDGMLFAEIFARFHREYTQHCIPEWTIAYFKVTRFDILRK